MVWQVPQCTVHPERLIASEGQISRYGGVIRNSRVMHINLTWYEGFCFYDGDDWWHSALPSDHLRVPTVRNTARDALLDFKSLGDVDFRR